MIRVKLPQHLRNLAGISGEVEIEVQGMVTQRALLDALEATYPMLVGTIRERGSGKRRSLVRFFASGEDLSHEAPDALLPDAVAKGKETFLIVGAMAGGA